MVLAIAAIYIWFCRNWTANSIFFSWEILWRAITQKNVDKKNFLWYLHDGYRPGAFTGEVVSQLGFNIAIGGRAVI